MQSRDEKPIWPLEPSPEEVKRLLGLAAERVAQFLGTLETHPAAGTGQVEEAARLGRRAAPERGGELEELLELIFDRLAPVGFNTAGPGFMAYVPGGGLFHSALAELVALVINRYPTVWAASPGLVELEISVLRWFAEWLGLPAGSGGYLSSGGSIANFSAVVAARRDRLGEDFLRGRLYASDQIHHSVEKAALLAGFPAGALRKVAVDSDFRVRSEALEAAIQEDRAAGLAPFMVIGSGGTTNTGAVDPLGELAELAARQGLWFHVDAAYGGFFVLTERGRARLAGIERADSITLDPHKGLFLPYGTGCLLVRDPETLRRSHEVGAAYMPPMQADTGRFDFAALSPELSREHRGLRVWLPLELLGLEPFRQALDEKLDVIELAHQKLSGEPDLEILAAPQLSALAFRLAPPGFDEDALDELNERLLAAINARQRVFLTATRLHGRFAIRICVLSFRTHQVHVERAIEDIRAAADEVR